MFRILLVLLTVVVNNTFCQGIVLAKDYHKNSTFQWNWAIDSLKKFSMKPTDKVLDVGSGDGKITAFIAKQVPQGITVGIDISEQMVAQATTLFQQSNLIFIQGSATNIPFKEQFDKITSFSTLHWVLDQETALKSMKDSLKSGGSMLLVNFAKSPNNLTTLAKKVASSKKWNSYFPIFKEERVYYTQAEYSSLLEKSGFKIQSIKEYISVYSYKDKASVIAWLTPVVTFISHLSPKMQEAFIDDIVNLMLQNNPPLPDGSIEIQQTKLEAIVLKP